MEGTLTVTEALAEVRVIEKRIAKKRGYVIEYGAADQEGKDPLASRGGRKPFVEKTLQAIVDLESRLIELRARIQTSNLTTDLRMRDRTMTVAQWLTWRKEVGPKRLEFTLGALGRIRAIRAKASENRYAVLTATQAAGRGDEWRKGECVIYLDEAGLLDEQEEIEALLGELDGKLTMLNSRTEIGVAPIGEDEEAPPSLKPE